MGEDEAIKENISRLKDKSYGKKMFDKATGYKIGATIGGLTGLIAAFVFKSKMVVCGVVGAVAGGYIGYKICEYKEPTFKLNEIGTKKIKKKKTS